MLLDGKVELLAFTLKLLQFQANVAQFFDSLFVSDW